MQTVVVIPTYNEKDNLPVIVPQILALTDADILVVDDGSPDGTGEIADQLSAQDPRVQVLHRSEKGGLGRAYIAGFRWALAREYSHIVEMDADLSHRPVDLPRLLARAARSDAPDLVVGSRWISGGGVQNWPVKRQLLSRASNLYVRILTGLKVADATAGFRVYRRDILTKLDLNQVQCQGYFFQVDMTLRVTDLNGSVVEVPITFVERTEGISKMTGSIIIESALRTATWGIARRGRALRRLLTRNRR